MRELFSGEYLRDVSSGFESAIDLESLQGVRHFRNVHTSEVWEPLMPWSLYFRFSPPSSRPAITEQDENLETRIEAIRPFELVGTFS
jgi:hypothetical protein